MSRNAVVTLQIGEKTKMATENVQFNGDQAANVTAGGTEYAQQLLNMVIAAAPRIIGAAIILILGWLIGRFIGGIVTRLADRFEIDRALQKTPIGDIMGGTEQRIARILGKLAKWFIYALAVLAAADVLAIRTLSQWISQAVAYLPAFVGGLLIILLGFVLADFVGDAIERTTAATRYRYTSMFANAVRVFLYFIVLVVGLETMGVNVGILYTFAQALSWGLALGIGLAVAIAFGLGGQDYVRENISDWSSTAREKAKEDEE
jgi:small-conductance mechanosensitive channel